MFTIVMMFIAAWAALMLDHYTLDRNFSDPESFWYYLRAPWETVRNTWDWIQASEK